MIKDAGKVMKQESLITVVWGLMLAMLRALWIASCDGLQTIGVFGNSDVELLMEKCSIISKICLLLPFVFVIAVDDGPTNSMSSSSSDGVFLWTGLRVSKHMIPSKQSSNPSLLRALAAWILSAFVNIWELNSRKN